MKLLVTLLLLGALQAWAVDPAECDVRLRRQAYRQDLREEFIARYVERVYTTEAQNLRYMELVKSRANRLHFVVGLGPLKLLNTRLGNFAFVTALANFQKELFLDEVHRRLPNLHYDLYSDFKFVNLALDENTDAATVAALEEAFLASVRRFDASLVVREIVRSNDLKIPWFSAGADRSWNMAWDKAGLTNRFARKDRARPLRHFAEAEVQDELNRQHTRVKQLHVQALGRMSVIGLSEEEQLRLEVFAEARKLSAEKENRAKSVKYFAESLSHLSRRQVGEEDAGVVLDYIRAVDGFSPNVMIAKREHLTIHDAPYGAIALDFIGLGAENLRGTARALIESTDLEDAIRRARVEEEAVTDRFNERKRKVEAFALEFFGGRVSVRFSGDDGVIIPAEKFPFHRQVEFVQRLAMLMPKPYFRMAVLGPEGAASPRSGELVAHAESVEKKMRALMLRQSHLTAPDMHFSIMTPDAGTIRKVFLVVASNRRLNLGEADWIKSIFAEAVGQVEADVHANGENTHYQAIDAFSSMGPMNRAVGQ